MILTGEHPQLYRDKARKAHRTWTCLASNPGPDSTHKHTTYGLLPTIRLLIRRQIQRFEAEDTIFHDQKIDALRDITLQV